MKRLFSIFGAILIASLSLTSCGSGSNTEGKDSKVKTDTIHKDTTSVVAVEKEVPASITKVLITYKEKEIGSKNSTDGSETLINKKTIAFNGCFDQELNKLIIEGAAKKISIIIKDDKGKVLFEKNDFDIDGSITFTKSDKKDINKLFYGSSILIKQKETTLFSYKITNSGCM